MNREKIISTITLIAKIVSFISLVMTVVIKVRVLLGLKNPSEEWRKKESDKTDSKNAKKSDGGKSGN